MSKLNTKIGDILSLKMKNAEGTEVQVDFTIVHKRSDEVLVIVGQDRLCVAIHDEYSNEFALTEPIDFQDPQFIISAIFA